MSKTTKLQIYPITLKLDRKGGLYAKFSNHKRVKWKSAKPPGQKGNFTLQLNSVQ